MTEDLTGTSGAGAPALDRRAVMAAVGAMAVAGTLPAGGRAALAAAGGTRTLAYVGTYTDRGKGIHLLEVNRDSGALTALKTFSDVPSPSSLVLSPDRRFLYAVSEITDYQGAKAGSVSAFAIDPATGDLRLLNTVSSEGAAPCHIGMDPQGRYVFVANYEGGNAAVMPVKPDGSLDKASHVQPISGPLGPERAKDAPPGSFAISGHDAPHAHMADLDPTGRFLLLSDLGTDRIFLYRFDREKGTLTPNDPPFVQAAPGAGPRHFAFHPNGTVAYSLNEEASTVDVMAYDAQRGALTIRQTLSTLPKGFEGTNFASEIAVSADGRFVYAGNRLHDTIAIFAAAGDGALTYQGQEWTRGSYPRHFDVEPGGKFLYVLHTRSDNITSFAVDRQTGGLTFTGRFTGIGNPSKIVFLTL
ncbi:lactonase family protein [Azospirillum thermophilum]|uniref:6-phosphogluconolactonase n=1 Tax=Azospirillum thermophilum TaxID=2202148 RepID=A0A2S2CXA8_9PROT|nr:lactonase family protein [Azospirillum thermophilum]AWK89153.1 6-phosphogluconolactonase [Azospirillum thermophilum]